MACSAQADSLRAEFRQLLERLPGMSWPDNAVAFFTLVRGATDTRDEDLCAAAATAYAENGVSVVPTLLIEDIDVPALVADSVRMAALPESVRQQWIEMAAMGPGPIDAV